jgi:hypothetical protein
MEQKPEKKQKTVKIFTKLALPMLACAVMLYSSCRKSDMVAPATKPAQATATKPSNDALTKQIVANLAHSLGGTYGGANTLSSVYNNSAFCGLVTDSTVDRSAMQGDTSSHMGGYLTFAFNCDNGNPSGFTASDSLATTRQTPDGWYQWYYIKQNYTIKCLNGSNQFVGVNGTNYYYQYMKLHAYDPADTKLYTDIQSCNFVLTNLKIDIANRDILSGTALFTAKGQDWNVTGTVNFVGNHIADVTIDGTVYHIDTRDFSW